VEGMLRRKGGREKRTVLRNFNSLIASNTFIINTNHSDSMDRRCDAVIAAKGGAIRY